MAWFFRIVEQDDGGWLCRHGRTAFDDHSSLHEALQHITGLAAAKAPAEVFLHRLDGTIELVTRFQHLGSARPPTDR